MGKVDDYRVKETYAMLQRIFKDFIKENIEDMKKQYENGEDSYIVKCEIPRFVKSDVIDGSSCKYIMKYIEKEVGFRMVDKITARTDNDVVICTLHFSNLYTYRCLKCYVDDRVKEG
ncbi:MAG: hypothetical protein ACRC7W_05165 [Fusobacteriaceae bacterium]